MCEKFRPTVEIFPGIAATNLKQGGNKLSKINPQKDCKNMCNVHACQRTAFGTVL